MKKIFVVFSTSTTARVLTSAHAALISAKVANTFFQQERLAGGNR